MCFILSVIDVLLVQKLAILRRWGIPEKFVNEPVIVNRLQQELDEKSELEEAVELADKGLAEGRKIRNVSRPGPKRKPRGKVSEKKKNESKKEPD
jgi:hypothetical protein